MRFAADTTIQNYQRFLSALETIVARSTVLASENAWLRYRTAQCDAVFDFFRPGTKAGAARERCEISVTRSHMRELDDLFELPLHH
jgi:uncharacterized protein YecT (DUF1311 family)